MNIIKGKGQRLIPEELLKYLEAFKKAHPDPEAGGGANLDDIVDSNGNKRFIEGNGTPLTVTGVTSSYCKWTLSGTHLMLVYAGSVAKNTFLSYTYLAEFALPDFILNKIVTTGASTIETKFITFYFSSNTLTFKVNLTKDPDTGKLRFFFDNSTTINTYNYEFRIQFDLIIDTE